MQIGKRMLQINGFRRPVTPSHRGDECKINPDRKVSCRDEKVSRKSVSDFFDDFHTDFDGFFVHRNQVMMAFR